jgi:hypothetical protein
MKTFLKINLAAPVAALLSTSALADPAPTVGEAFAAALAGLPHDGTSPAQNATDKLSAILKSTAADPAARKAFSSKMAALLTTALNHDSKTFLCRQLASIGSEADVPSIAPLLAEAATADMARDALEGIGGAKSAEALRLALPKAPGKSLAGIINSLAVLKDAAAVPALAVISAGADPAAAAVAVDALGKIGGPSADRVLETLHHTVSGKLLDNVQDAWLGCAGHPASPEDRARSLKICQQVLEKTKATAIRQLALRTLLNTSGPNAPLPAESDETGFEPLFNGRDLSGWQGSDYEVVDGVIICHGHHGGYLGSTRSDYANFILRFEVKFSPGSNNGLNFRTDGPIWNELQILDDTHALFHDIKPWQSHGSLYGVAPAKRGHLKPTGEWNAEEVIADGTKIKVTLNGFVILDLDLAQLDLEHCADGTAHRGLRRTTGGLGWLGHLNSSENPGPIFLRNIRLKRLP